MPQLWLWLVIFLVGCGAPLPENRDLAPAPEVEDLARGIAPSPSLSPSPSLTPSPTPTPSPMGCPSDMVAIDAFCMDRYEAPNVAGEKPLAMQTAPDGELWCNARGKRLCTEAEWVRACQGPAILPYPYGTTYKRSTCDDDKTWLAPDWTTLGTWPSAAAMAEADRLYQADPSGARTGCVSAEGVYDLTGNVAEWVKRSFDHANNYAEVMKGCYWSGCYGGSPPSCGFTNPAHPGTFRSYEAGFRCCQ
jgi:formylglycine-generating enzyme required for sulfatase activity